MPSNINFGGYVGNQIYIENPVDLDGYHKRIVNWYKNIKQLENKEPFLILTPIFLFIAVSYLEDFIGTEMDFIKGLIGIFWLFSPFILGKTIKNEKLLLRQELEITLPQLAMRFPNDERFYEIEKIYRELQRL